MALNSGLSIFHFRFSELPAGIQSPLRIAPSLLASLSLTFILLLLCYVFRGLRSVMAQLRTCLSLSRGCLLVLLAFLGWTSAVGAIENKCSACIAVQQELMDILVQERPKGNLDLRNRLNTQGKREGKIVDYKDSELRIVDILEELCAKVKKYSLIRKSKNEKRFWSHGQTTPTDELKLIKEEQGKELKRWCDRMLEMHEDEMADLIREEMKQGYKDLPILLCRNITKNCKDEDTYMKELDRMGKSIMKKPGDKPEAEKKTVLEKFPGIELPGMPGVPHPQFDNVKTAGGYVGKKSGDSKDEL